MVYCSDRCMNTSDPINLSICVEKFDGRLIIDYEVCFLQHFCESCPYYDDVMCDKIVIELEQ